MISKGLLILWGAAIIFGYTFAEAIGFDPRAIFVSIVGWLLYNSWMLVKYKDPIDNTNKKFNHKSYLGAKWDNMLFSFFVAMVLSWFGPQIDILQKQINATSIEFGDLIYIMTGPAVQLFYKYAKDWK